MENRIVIGMSYDPWHNLALEEILFEQQAEQQGVTLYLWQNENTVVIGKHQNAWLECRMALLEEEGGKLARRSSGGGAVFHDLGNLNFTFLARQSDYDLKRQMRVIGNAVGYFGIETEMTGRNDLVVKAEPSSPATHSGFPMLWACSTVPFLFRQIWINWAGIFPLPKKNSWQKA